ncbi:PorT family protein [Hymenobacter latericus]|uniref:PorT family protein n=1 Tax=Hymenobacter sp. YIM 151858-1 TaxID=2987688 RepID=UPI002225E4F0|nr:PorT family protein [Hymenobacter sp. YIM 151858-1]UYZ60727.1 PorT family protein [Hymenobacter sp. YIM 151858-1]
MTEHDQQDFFRELHDKLHDFGAEPPADAWAGIQSRLPQQKKDRRLFFYLSTAAALLLLGVALLGGFHRFNMPFGGGAAGRSAQPVAVRPASTGGQAGQAAGALPNGQPTNPGAAGPTNPGAADAQAIAAQGTRESATADATAGAYASNASASAGTRSALGASEVSNGLAPAAASSGYAAVTDAKARRRTSRSAGTKHLGALAAASTGTAARSRTGRLGKEQGMASLGSRAATRRTGSNTLAAASNAAASRESGLTRNSLRRAARPKTGLSAVGISEGGSGFSASTRTATHGRIRGASLPLEPTAPEVALTEPEEPEVQRTRRSNRRPQSRRARIIKGLSVEMLAGAAYSYRHLSGNGTKAQRQLTSLERPAVGYSGQLNVAYALNRQAKVSVGLGYTDYATRYRYQVQKSSGSVLKIDQRDVYRFMVVPVQMQYKLAGNHRYALGWLAGGTLGVYTGGRTTEGSACNCTQNNDPTTDARYRSFTVAATAGAFVDYNLTPDVRLLLRPTLQYHLTSLTAPSSGLLQRRPVSVGLQTGLSFNLKEPKRPAPAIAKH